MSTNHRKSKFAIPGISPCCGKGPHDHRKKDETAKAGGKRSPKPRGERPRFLTPRIASKGGRR